MPDLPVNTISTRRLGGHWRPRGQGPLETLAPCPYIILSLYLSCNLYFFTKISTNITFRVRSDSEGKQYKKQNKGMVFFRAKSHVLGISSELVLSCENQQGVCYLLYDVASLWAGSVNGFIS